MKELYIGIGTIILGWLLGLLSSPITSRINRKYKERDFRKTIITELEGLAFRLAISCVQVDLHLGESEKERLGIIKSVVSSYTRNTYQDVVSLVNEISYSDYQALTAKSKKPAGSYLGVKRFSVPFLEVALKELDLFSPDIQGEMLWVRERVGILNEEIEYSMSFSNLTYNNEIMKTNGTIINKNVESSYRYICDQCQEIASRAHMLVSKLK